jgi:hypothetical protein
MECSWSVPRRHRCRVHDCHNVRQRRQVLHGEGCAQHAAASHARRYLLSHALTRTDTSRQLHKDVGVQVTDVVTRHVVARVQRRVGDAAEQRTHLHRLGLGIACVHRGQREPRNGTGVKVSFEAAQRRKQNEPVRMAAVGTSASKKPSKSDSCQGKATIKAARRRCHKSMNESE